MTKYAFKYLEMTPFYNINKVFSIVKNKEEKCGVMLKALPISDNVILLVPKTNASIIKSHKPKIKLKMYNNQEDMFCNYYKKLEIQRIFDKLQ